MNDFLSDLITFNDSEAQQFFAEIGRKSAANYVRKHNITRPPKDEDEALEWARAAAAEYINQL